MGGLFFKPGLTKTSITLKALSVLKHEGLMHRALVVAPLRVCAVTWPDEAAKWTDFHGLRWVFLHGDDKDYLLKQKADVYLINHDGLEWLFADGYKKFLAMKFDVLVIDESSKFRNTRTVRFKLLKKILPTFKRRWILTGSPSPKSYMDLFGQIYILDLGKAFSPYVTHFRMNYFTPLDRMGWSWALQPGAARLIEKQIAPYVLTLDEQDVKLKVPKQIPETIHVDLPPAARKIYDELENDLITYVEQKAITAASLGVVYGKCAQLANGGIYHPRLLGEKRQWTDVHNEKAKAVKQLLGRLKTPAFVVYDYEHDLARLLAVLGKNTPRIGGGTNMKTSIGLMREWNAGEIPCLLVHAKAMAHGLNFQLGPGNNIIWHSIPDDFEDYEQLNYRIGRNGASYENFYTYHVVARDTVDVAKMQRLRRKDRTQAGFLAALKLYAKARKPL